MYNMKQIANLGKILKFSHFFAASPNMRLRESLNLQTETCKYGLVDQLVIGRVKVVGSGRVDGAQTFQTTFQSVSKCLGNLLLGVSSNTLDILQQQLI